MKTGTQKRTDGKKLVATLELKHRIQYTPVPKQSRSTTTEQYIDQLIHEHGLPMWVDDGHGGKSKVFDLPDNIKAQVVRQQTAVIPIRDLLMREYIKPLAPTHMITFHPKTNWVAEVGSNLDDHQRESAYKLVRNGYNNMRQRLGVDWLELVSFIERAPDTNRLHYHAFVRIPERYDQFNDPEKEFSKDLYVSWGKTKCRVSGDTIVYADDNFKNFDIQRIDQEDWIVCAGYMAKTAYSSDINKFLSLDQMNSRGKK